ncbi:hypothetical protein [Aureimonas sp. AU12]|uniref:hypothetical protein n=1 Tax=Aureimonas sp. AU12 TaxID=1638161 RepID=UPI000785F39B|nr:hypothetical protein [Aureimonas sp. AU12]
MTSGRPHRLPAPLAALAALLLVSATTAPAFAFSQITGENGEAGPVRDGIVSVPLPPVPGQPTPPQPPMTPPPAAPTAPAATVPAAPAPVTGTQAPTTPAPPVAPVAPLDPDADSEGVEIVPDPDAPAVTGEAPAPDVAPADIAYGEDKLPQPVRDLRRKLIEIAKSGDVEKLRPYIETGANATALSLIQTDEDPIETLKGASGDGDGVEILAILLETLEAGHVHLDQSGDNEIFVWPYFTQVNLEKLTKPQLVELFELVTAGDYQRMLGNGSYDFYRVGISPEGRFEFFVAGD